MNAENPYRLADSKLYSRMRPGYPQAAVDQLLSDQPRVIVDVGAGTGTLTRQLLQAGGSLRVLAVEPSASMRESWCADPRVELYSGSSEATGLPDACADLVVWAQSFHWIDRESSAVELDRILAAGGCGAVLVNQMDVAEPWVHRLTRIMRSGDVIRRSWNPQLVGFRTSGPLTYRWDHTLVAEEVLELARTRSSYIGSSPENRDRMQQNLRWYLFEHLGYDPGEEIAIPHLTYLWWLQRA